MLPKQLLEELLQYIVLILVWRSGAHVAVINGRNIILFRQFRYRNVPLQFGQAGKIYPLRSVYHAALSNALGLLL